ncbi:MAG: UDP-3-O-(3-hydroxymyristoyl)glucosamine N-acyltransferase [Acidobacteriota bacterium]
MNGDLRIRLADLAELVGGSLEGDEEQVVTGIAPLDEASGDEVSFISQPRYRSKVASSGAGALIASTDFQLPSGCRKGMALIRVDNPYLAVSVAISTFHPLVRVTHGVDSTALIGDGVEIGPGVHIGALVSIGDRVRLGSGTVIETGSVLAAGVQVGSDCTLYPNVTIYGQVVLGDRVVVHAGSVIGADGFGYARDGRKHVKIPQVGGVVVEDDVEIGANVCIDRATLGVTLIGRGTKIDNMVQIGHNCEIGEDCILCGQVGLGGTTSIGTSVLIGGQAGASGHLRIGEGAMVAAQTGIINDVPAGTRVAGYPHLELSRWRRSVAALRHLPRLVRRVRRLEAAAGLSREEEQ